MSENSITENENTMNDAAMSQTADAETAATVEAAETAETQESPAAATSAIIKIEGQEIPLDPRVAGDDALLKKALSPYYPSIKNAQISRETAATGQMIVSIVKRAEHKGAGGRW